MGLVSGIYRMAPPEGTLTPTESAQRLTRILQRLVNLFGEAETLRRIREAPVPRNDEALKSWIMLTAFGMERQRQDPMLSR